MVSKAGVLSGGIGAEIGEGNFLEGATRGAIISGLNHIQHLIKSIETALSQRKNWTAAAILAHMTEAMKVLDYISGGEMAKFNPALDKFSLAIKGGIRMKTGFKLKLT